MEKKSYTNTKLRRILFVVVVFVVGLPAITSLVYFFSGEEVGALFKAINPWDEKNEEYLFFPHLGTAIRYIRPAGFGDGYTCPNHRCHLSATNPTEIIPYP